MGIHRPNLFLMEEFSSPGVPKFRLEMDVLIEPDDWQPLKAALDAGPSKLAVAREILMARLPRDADPRAARLLRAALPDIMGESG